MREVGKVRETKRERRTDRERDKETENERGRDDLMRGEEAEKDGERERKR